MVSADYLENHLSQSSHADSRLICDYEFVNCDWQQLMLLLNMRKKWNVPKKTRYKAGKTKKNLTNIVQM